MIVRFPLHGRLKIFVTSDAQQASAGGKLLERGGSRAAEMVLLWGEIDKSNVNFWNS